MAATRLIPLHVNKGKTVAQCLADRTDYSENAAKTTHSFGFYANYFFYTYIKIIVIVEMLTRQKNEVYSFYKGKNNQIIEKMLVGRETEKSTLEML